MASRHCTLLSPVRGTVARVLNYLSYEFEAKI